MLAGRIIEFLGLRRNVVVLLGAIVLIGTGEELWIRFVPKYLETLGASVFLIGLYDGLKTLLGAVYAYPGGVVSDRWGHRRALLSFTATSVAGYAMVLLVPHRAGVIVGMFFFLSWSNLSLPAMFSLIGASLPSTKHAMGIGVQSLIKRIPILIGPALGGILLDRLGIVRGVQAGLIASILTGLCAMVVQRGFRDAEGPSPSSLNHFTATVRTFHPELRRLLFSDILIRFCERIPFAWVVIYAMDHLHLSASQFGILTAIEMAAAVACYVPTAYLADRYGKEPFVIATFVFFTLFPAALLAAGDFQSLAVAFLIRGLKEFGEPARKGLIIGLAAQESRGQTIGAYYLIRDTVVTTGSFLGAALWKLGPRVNFWSALILGAAGTLAYAATLPRRGRSASR